MLAFGPLLIGAGRESANPGNPTLIGQRAPDFSLPDLSGQTVTLKQFAGKPVVLSFFGNGCAPCLAEAAHLSRFQQIYQSKGLVVLGINAWDEPSSEVLKIAKRRKITHRLLVQGGQVARSGYRLGPVPTTFWIDRQGKIVHQSFGFSEKDLSIMESWIKRIVGPG